MAFGVSAKAMGDRSVALGASSVANGDRSMALVVTQRRMVLHLLLLGLLPCRW
ncbi:hypothetical protein DMI65_13515 [Escherichia coli]|nr:hypothetical protein [Escherichia coli]